MFSRFIKSRSLFPLFSFILPIQEGKIKESFTNDAITKKTLNPI
ncbi:hypothetical protein KP78_38280 [Jeotgalibacillus soli]|uniref:Uncharacterized protein n=1 Tax=Jeotgalibacillus soli TaxID=889306 RepID=A0A0C2VDH9_9BACL|nr:hypothetical protein KP78_38280 [Jeotgalibacillus soli]